MVFFDLMAFITADKSVIYVEWIKCVSHGLQVGISNYDAMFNGPKISLMCNCFVRPIKKHGT